MLEGDLTDFALPDILRLLSATSKTGRLHVQHDTVVARIDLVDGRVRDASADARRLSLARRLLGAGLVDAEHLRATLADADGELPSDLDLARRLVTAGSVEAASLAELVREQTVDALFDILRWPAGRFRFDGAALTAGGDGAAVLDLSIKLDDLLADATARLEHWPDIESATGDGAAVVAIVRPPGDDEVGLPPDAWSLLTLVDGRRSVDELVALTGRGQYRTRSLLRTLVDAGVVRAGTGDDLGPVARLLAAHRVLANLEARLAGDTPAEDPDDALEVLEAQLPADEPLAHPTRARRLAIDPDIDPPLVRRLMQGVEEL